MHNPANLHVCYMKNAKCNQSIKHFLYQHIDGDNEGDQDILCQSEGCQERVSEEAADQITEIL